MKVEMAVGADASLYLNFKIDKYFDVTLGPKIVEDAKRYCPVRTGELRESIGHYVTKEKLVVFAAAPYAAYVELGHRVAHGPGMSEVGPEVVAPQPFLRPALYQKRL